MKRAIIMFREGAAAIALSLCVVACGGHEPQSSSANVDASVPGVPAVADLRFRGVGLSLHQSGSEDLGGPVAGGGPFRISTIVQGFSVALTDPDSFVRFFMYPNDGGNDYVSDLVADGASCPSSLAKLMAKNEVILGIGGDVFSDGTTCTMLGVGTPDGGPKFIYAMAEGLSFPALQAAVTRPSSSVITALASTDAGYAYVAEGTANGGLESFESLLATASPETLESAAEGLADAGYVITASTWDGHLFELVGSRRAGDTVPRAAIVKTGSDVTFGQDFAQLPPQGYAAVSFLDVSKGADGGFGGFYIIWEKL